MDNRKILQKKKEIKMKKEIQKSTKLNQVIRLLKK